MLAIDKSVLFISLFENTQQNDLMRHDNFVSMNQFRLHLAMCEIIAQKNLELDFIH